MHPTILGQDIFIHFAGTGDTSLIEAVEIVNLANSTSITVPGNASLNLTTGVVSTEEPVSIESRLIHTYPNPAANKVNIEFYVSHNDYIKVSVCNINGQIVADYSEYMYRGMYACKFIPEHSGMYFISVAGNNFLWTRSKSYSLEYLEYHSSSHRFYRICSSPDTCF